MEISDKPGKEGLTAVFVSTVRLPTIFSGANIIVGPNIQARTEVIIKKCFRSIGIFLLCFTIFGFQQLRLYFVYQR